MSEHRLHFLTHGGLDVTGGTSAKGKTPPERIILTCFLFLERTHASNLFVPNSLSPWHSCVSNACVSSEAPTTAVDAVGATSHQKAAKFGSATQHNSFITATDPANGHAHHTLRHTCQNCGSQSFQASLPPHAQKQRRFQSVRSHFSKYRGPKTAHGQKVTHVHLAVKNLSCCTTGLAFEPRRRFVTFGTRRNTSRC